MTTIHPETQVVASTYDPLTRICSYTYQHTDGSRYTVQVPLDELNTKGNRANRRMHLATKIMHHIQSNPPDKIDEPDDGQSPA